MATNSQQLQERSRCNGSIQEMLDSRMHDKDPDGKTLDRKQGSKTRHCTPEEPKAKVTIERTMEVLVKTTQTAVGGAHSTQQKDIAGGLDQPGQRMNILVRWATTMRTDATKAAVNTAESVNETRTDPEKVRRSGERTIAEDKTEQRVQGISMKPEG